VRGDNRVTINGRDGKDHTYWSRDQGRFWIGSRRAVVGRGVSLIEGSRRSHLGTAGWRSFDMVCDSICRMAPRVTPYTWRSVEE